MEFAALESIDVRGNNVEWFPLEVVGLSSLRHLDLSQNSMTEIPTELLSATTSLRTLVLTGNPLLVPQLADKGLSDVQSYLQVLLSYIRALQFHFRQNSNEPAWLTFDVK